MKEKRQLYDFLGERERKKRLFPDKTFDLVIDPTKDNPVDGLFMSHYLRFGVHLKAQKLKNWYVIGLNNGKRVEGRLVDIFPSRDILAKTEKSERRIIPFEDVVFFAPNKL